MLARSLTSLSLVQFCTLKLPVPLSHRSTRHHALQPEHYLTPGTRVMNGWSQEEYNRLVAAYQAAAPGRGCPRGGDEARLLAGGRW